MAEHLGKMIECDLCGKTAFLKYTGTTSLDGGYSKVDNFEKRPEGWLKIRISGISFAGSSSLPQPIRIFLSTLL